ncbi:MAG: ABC-F family ATP-binding cassette domain-containing protein [Flavobacteriaceae bacterium]|nr:ABC-F family ATP-binding cassette domain-containing protein [Flavobacteriaceae bacterium]
MIDVNNLTVTFAGTPLFWEIGFKLTPGSRVGLIGKNGAGKSTLLKVIAGEQEYTGTLSIDKGTKIGFLKQDIDFNHGRTILEEAYLAFTEIKSIETELEQIHLDLENRTDYESEAYHEVLHQMDDLNHRYQLIGGYNYKGDTEKILQGLGFKSADFDKLTDTFSGGWRMRIELAKLLLQQNDVLLLDEPTNHLDIDSILWFENFLKSYQGVVLLVSHDRMFLDEVTNRTIEISLGSIYDFKKPYSHYISIRQELIEKQLQAQKNQEKQIKQTEQLIEKFRYKASKAAFAQSLIKKLDKVERIEVDVEDHSVMNVKFPISEQPGRVIFTLDKISKYYGSKKVLENVSLLFERGSKIAFVGQNGMGKTTLAKILVNEISYDGQVELGHNVKIGYFAQNQSDYLNGENNLLQEMESAADDNNRVKIRSLLGSFLFGGDAVEKKVKMLSGGERNRLALSKMLLNPFNVLIMDEPTNHLDMLSKNVLKKALNEFEGSLIVVSHDRDFLQGLVNKVYEFRDNQIKEYLGDIDYYLEQRKFDNFREVEKNSIVEIGGKVFKGNARDQEKYHKKVKNQISKIESQIETLEAELLLWDQALVENNVQIINQPDFFKKYQDKKDQIAILMEQWTELQM